MKKTKIGKMSLAACAALCLTACADYLQMGPRGAEGFLTVQYAPVQNEAIVIPSKNTKEIRYKSFSLPVDPDFVIYHELNNDNNAMWYLSNAVRNKEGKSDVYTYFVGARRYPHSLKDSKIETILEYEKYRAENPPGSKFKNLETLTEQSEFHGLPAVHSYTVSHEEKRNLTMRVESYTVADPEDPHYLMEFTWSERGRKEELKSPALEEKGKRFLETVRLKNTTEK